MSQSVEPHFGPMNLEGNMQCLELLPEPLSFSFYMQSRIAEAKKQYANSPVESIPFPLWEPPPAGMKQLSTLCEPSFRINMTKASCV
jgi:hypothetical protein